MENGRCVLRVLMLHDCAFVGRELGEYLRRHKHVDVKYVEYPKQTKTSVVFMARNLRKLCDNKTLIHVHYCRYPAYVAMLSGKPYILHCHGTDIRHGLNLFQKLAIKKAKKALIAEPEPIMFQLIPNAVYLPTPVNTEKFYPMKEHDGERVLYFRKWYDDQTVQMEKLCKKYRYDLTVLDYGSKRVPYEKMSVFLNYFDIFIDQHVNPSVSKTALEAMACGLATVTYLDDHQNILLNLKDSSFRRERVKWQGVQFVSKHSLGKVADQLFYIYQEVLESL